MTKKSIIIVSISTLFAIFVILLCLFLAVKSMDATISSFTTESSESVSMTPEDVQAGLELAAEAASSDEGPHFDILAGITYTSSGNSLALYLDAVPVSANKYYVTGSAYHMGKLMPSMNIKDFFSLPKIAKNEDDTPAAANGKKKSAKAVDPPAPDENAKADEYQDSTGNISLRFTSDSTIFIRDARSSSIMPFSGELHLAKAAPSENSISEDSVSFDSLSGNSASSDSIH